MKVRLSKAKGFNPIIFFFGTEEEIQMMQNIEREKKERIKKVLDTKFSSISFTNGWSQTVILHPSPRRNVVWQMSYIDYDGVPAKHESYLKTGPTDETIHSLDELVEVYFSASWEKGLTLTIEK